MNTQRGLILVFLLSAFAGCGGGGSGDDSDGAATPVELEGVFIDDPVQGLGYQSGDLEGVTDENGTFFYVEGEPLSFFIDGVLLGTLPGGADEVTPYDFGSATINIARLLQSLDTTPGEPGIDLTGVELAGTPIDFTQSPAQFGTDPAVLAAVAAAQAVGGSGALIDQATAIAHLNGALNRFSEAEFDDVVLFARSDGADPENCLTFMHAGGTGEDLCQHDIADDPFDPLQQFNWHVSDGELIVQYGDPVAVRVVLSRLRTDGTRVTVSATEQCFPGVDPECVSAVPGEPEEIELFFGKRIRADDLADRAFRPASDPASQFVFDADGTSVSLENGIEVDATRWSVDPAFDLLSSRQVGEPLGTMQNLRYNRTILIDGSLDDGTIAEFEAMVMDMNGDGLLDDSEIEAGTVYQDVYTYDIVRAGNSPPRFTSGSLASTPENETATGYTAAAEDRDGDTPVFDIFGGADQAAFNIGTTSGVLRFNSAPDFENPIDVDGNNDYEVIVRVQDGNGGSATLEVTVTVTDVPPPPGNLVLNPGFEDGKNHWYKGGNATVVDNNVHSGERALRFRQVDVEGEIDETRQDILGIVPGQTYEISAWVKGDDLGGPTGVRIRYYFADDGTRVGDSFVLFSQDGTFDYTQSTVRATAPAGTNELHLNLINYSSGTGTSYADDFAVHVVDDP